MDFAAAIVRLGVLGVAVFAATGPSVFGQGKGSAVPNYEPSTEATFKGTVEQVKEVDHAGYRGKGLHVTLKTAEGTFDVHLGPASYVTKEITVAPGDQLEVVGSKVKSDGAESIIARTVKKGDKTATLRNSKGVPLWSGGRRKNQ